MLRALCVTHADTTATREGGIRAELVSCPPDFARDDRARCRYHVRVKFRIARELKTRWTAPLELIARDAASEAETAYIRSPNAARKAEVGNARNSAKCLN